MFELRSKQENKKKSEKKVYFFKIIFLRNLRFFEFDIYLEY